MTASFEECKMKLRKNDTFQFGDKILSAIFNCTPSFICQGHFPSHPVTKYGPDYWAKAPNKGMENFNNLLIILRVNLKFTDMMDFDFFYSIV